MKHDKEKISTKIILLYFSIVFFILLFLIRVFYIVLHKPSYFISTKIIKKDLAIRGKIISQDNFIIAQNQKIYDVAIFPKYIDKNKTDILINLLSLYTNNPKEYFKEKLDTNKTRVILLKNISYNIEKNLQYLSTLLNIKNVFTKKKNSDIIYGLDIYEKLSTRDYPLQNSLEPIIGYIRLDPKTNQISGQMGLEKYYNSILIPQQNGYIKGLRDVKNNIIYDNNTIIKHRKDGENLYLNINLILQGKIEHLIDNLSKEFNSSEILSVVMNSKDGKIISIASSNRYNPMNILKQDIPKLKINFIQYSYEPGSVMKPITLAMLLEKKRVNPFEVLDVHNGVFYFKKNFTIYDDEPFKWLNVIQAIIHSSNIVFAQLGLRLSASEFRNGLLKFGFGKKSGIDLPYEYKGILFSQKDLISETHRASNSFGYAMQVNLIQLLKAYNCFNNNGIMITPKIAYKYGNNIIETQSKQIISASTAQTILNILRKVVQKGTAKATNIKGLFIAGKTGTAKISQNGEYTKKLYNSTFIGFANDKNHKYTIAILVIKPDKKHFFASQSAVVVFRNIINIMLELNLLNKMTEKGKIWKIK